MRSIKGRQFARITLVYLIGILVAILTNFATNVFPESWKPHLWIAWPLLGALILIGILLLVTDGGMPTYARGGTEEDRAAFNRRSMLNAVTATWIDGVLKRSILRQIMIRLGLESRPDMLRDPWDLVIEHQGSSQVLGPETSLRDLMYQNRGLLILGEPGAGKTTLLLELLKELVEQAENDRTMPIPVVFKLETWKTADHLAGWLIDQLSGERYGVARDIAEQWVINSRVLPLLDGLDEVSLDQRLECARAIDKFHAENSLLPIVVTSRIADYESLALKLALGAAVAVQPLTSSQVEDYLDRIGEPFSGLRSALHSDPLLWELMRTPFFLGIAVATYEGKEAVELFANTSIDDRRTQLIAAFVERSLSRKPSQRSYDPRRAAQWLSVLARALGMRFETVFFIESVDANWLSLPWRRLVIGTISTLSGIIDGLTIYFILKLFMTGYVPLIAGTISGLCFTLLSYFLRTDEGNPVIHFEGGKHGTVLASKLGCWVSATVPIALICGLMGGVIGAIFGAIMSPITGAPFFADVERYCIIWTLCGAVLPLGAMAVLGGEDSSRKDLQQRPTGKDLRDAIWLSFALSLCLGVPAFIVFGGWYGPNGVIAGAAVAVSAGYLYSGSGILGYWLTNLRLAQTGTVPFKKVRFLNYAVSRMLMYKVGGGYMFAHRLMLEYFAYLDHGDTSDRPLYHSLPSVDLRPETVLEHARNDATNGKINLVKALTYAGTYLPAKEFSSGAWDIAMTIEGEVRKFLIDAGRAYQLSYTPEFSIKTVSTVYQLIVSAGDPDYVPAAAFRRGEVLVAALATSREFVYEPPIMRWEEKLASAIHSYRIAANFTEFPYSETALSRLNGLESPEHSGEALTRYLSTLSLEELLPTPRISAPDLVNEQQAE